MQSLHSKNGYLTEPQKGSVDDKMIQMRLKSQKKDKKSMKPLKILPVYPSEEPFATKSFF
jgi:hypothetical protein